MGNELIYKKITFIKDSLGKLKRILNFRKEEKDPEKKEFLLLSAEKKAEEIIESAIKINQTILKEEFNHFSESYYDSFMDLEKLEIFEADSLEKLAKTAGFRNRLAYDYMDLDEKIVGKTLENILKIYPDYLLKIIDRIGKSKKSGIETLKID